MVSVFYKEMKLHKLVVVVVIMMMAASGAAPVAVAVTVTGLTPPH